MLSAAALKCSGGKTSRFTTMPTVTPAAHLDQVAEGEPVRVVAADHQPRRAAVGIQSLPEPILGARRG